MKTQAWVRIQRLTRYVNIYEKACWNSFSGPTHNVVAQAEGLSVVITICWVVVRLTICLCSLLQWSCSSCTVMLRLWGKGLTSHPGSGPRQGRSASLGRWQTQQVPRAAVPLYLTVCLVGRQTAWNSHLYSHMV